MENQVTNKLLLITTTGCEGCTIARNVAKEAIKEHSKVIVFEEQTAEEIGKKALKQLRVRDFPAIFLYKGDTLKLRHIGTVPKTVFLRWFDVWF